jgi:trehalose-phosphatase
LDYPDLPSALERLPDITERLGRLSPAFFLDFDGTLAPIATKPELAEIARETRSVIDRLARKYPVCVVSGRSLDTLKGKIGLRSVFLAADHGHRVVGPRGSGVDFEVTPADNDELARATQDLQQALREIEGVLMEIKEVSLAVHYRRVAEHDKRAVRAAVDDALKTSPGLKLMEGKMVYELVPDVAWNKGQAVLWLLEYLKSGMHETHVPICIGDDVTDEDMFKATLGRGISVVVGALDRDTDAEYQLGDTSEVTEFLTSFVTRSESATTEVV